MLPVALTIAGSDPSGGAGVQADLKTFQRHGAYGTGVVTLLTVQDTTAVHRVDAIDAELVAEQLDALLADVPPAAAKCGALGSAAIAAVVAERLVGRQLPFVVDPVRIATHGSPLLARAAREVLLERLLPAAALVTPNAQEAAWLSGEPVEDQAGVERAARRLLDTGVGAVMITGGHVPGPDAVDLLWTAEGPQRLSAPRVAGRFHGLGCALSAAITARLACGESLPAACAAAKRWLHAAMLRGLRPGAGLQVIDHTAPVD